MRIRSLVARPRLRLADVNLIPFLTARANLLVVR